MQEEERAREETKRLRKYVHRDVCSGTEHKRWFGKYGTEVYQQRHVKVTRIQLVSTNAFFHRIQCDSTHVGRCMARERIVFVPSVSAVNVDRSLR